MSADSRGTWKLEGFIERLDEWIERESPGDDLRLAVTSWVLSRLDDPYEGVRREPGFPNLWFGVVPRTGHDDNRTVVCSYWIQETLRRVRCDSIAGLRWPG